MADLIVCFLVKCIYLSNWVIPIFTWIKASWKIWEYIKYFGGLLFIYGWICTCRFVFIQLYFGLNFMYLKDKHFFEFTSFEGCPSQGISQVQIVVEAFTEICTSNKEKSNSLVFGWPSDLMEFHQRENDRAKLDSYTLQPRGLHSVEHSQYCTYSLVEFRGMNLINILTPTALREWVPL